MTNVYIKSFARPFYLDRCIRSIRFNLRGHDRIVVLDDGTERAHLDRIRDLHPDVEIRSSGADDGKMALLRQEKFSEIAARYPSAPRFWVSEIGEDPHDYTLVLEDDAWLTRHVDLGTL
ncbi:MAG TPA: glycosyltransferase family 2 protein, partial [Acidimicrobiia bacterium]